MNGVIKDNTRSTVNKRRIFRLLYPALIIFFIFSFCESIFGVFKYFELQDFFGKIESICLLLFWLILIIQIFSSFLRVYEMSKYMYPTITFVSDCIEILLIIAMVVTIESLLDSNPSEVRLNYIQIYGIIVALVINQGVWFLSLKKIDRNAFIRIIALLTFTLGLLVWEIYSQCIWNHIIFIIVFIFITVLSVIDNKEVRSDSIQ